MKTEEFNKLVEEQIDRCRNMLIRKSTYGSESDRLHNFKAFAALSGESQEEVCGGYLGKHLVSIYDMISKTGKGSKYLLPEWDEKIGDAINYLLILSAIVREDLNTVVSEMYPSLFPDKTEAVSWSPHKDQLSGKLRSVIFNNRKDAEDVLSSLAELLMAYGRVTIADLDELIGADSEPIHRHRGWRDLTSAKIFIVEDEYFLDLPQWELFSDKKEESK